MKKIIFILGVLSLFFTLNVSAKDIQVSRTFKVKMPFKLKTEVEMFSLKSKLYNINEAPNSSQILLMHNKPQTLANKFSVERYWKDSRLQTKAFDKNEKDHGCHRNTARFFECSRDVNQDGRNISETLYWNVKNDLVLVRVSSNSVSESRKIIEQIQAVPNSRLPAQATRNKKSGVRK